MLDNTRKQECIIFRVDAGADTGLGHVMRCLALAQGLHSRNVKVIFAVSQSSLRHCQSRSDWVGVLHVITASSRYDEHLELQQLCTKEQADWLILDGYQFDSGYRKLLDLNTSKLAMFDDGQLLDAGIKDEHLSMIINWASGADKLNYNDLAPNAWCCAGDSYRVLRQEFYHVQTLPFDKRNRLILMFGGSDPSQLTLPLLKLFSESSIRLPITIITGSGYQHTDELEKFIKHSHLSIEHFHDCQQVAEVFQQGRLAISAAGASQFELLHCATPSILVVTAKNQLFASEQARGQGWCFVSIENALQEQTTIEMNAKALLLEQIVQKSMALWHQPELLNQMHSNALSARQQAGFNRIFTALYSELPNEPHETNLL